MRSLTVEWSDPAALAAAGRSMSGLEFLRAIRDGRLPQPPIAQLLGFRLAEVEPGRAVFEIVPGEQHYNPIGVVHGGVAMTLLDSAMGCAIHTTLGVGERYTTLEVKANFVRPITVETGRVSCEAVVVHRGGTIATAEAKLVIKSSGKLLAHGSTTCLIIK
jgi:uncharacterized protein (TIGR00369 family)